MKKGVRGVQISKYVSSNIVFRLEFNIIKSMEIKKETTLNKFNNFKQNND
jgi:hypothetical protein